MGAIGSPSIQVRVSTLCLCLQVSITSTHTLPILTWIMLCSASGTVLGQNGIHPGERPWIRGNRFETQAETDERKQQEQMRKLLESPEFQGAVKDLDSALKELANKQASQKAGRNDSQDPVPEAALRDLLLQHQAARQSLQHPDAKEGSVPATHISPDWKLVGAGALFASVALLGIGLLFGRQLARRTPEAHQGSSQSRRPSVVIQSPERVDPETAMTPSDSCAPPVGMVSNEELSRRGNLGESVAETIQGFRSIHWKAVFPWHVAFMDKPWDLLWVRWLLMFGLFPSVASVLCGDQDGTRPLPTVCVAGYVALFWALGLRSVVKPPSVSASSMTAVLAVQISIFVSLLLLGIRVEWLNSVFAVTASSSAFWRIAALLLVWMTVQSILAGALLWWQERLSGATRLLYLGSISGMALAASPAVARYLNDDWFGSYRGASLGAFRSETLPSLMSSMVLGLLTGGVLAAIISIGKATPVQSRRIAVVGTFAAAFVMMLHSLTLTTGAHSIVVAASTLGFVTYLRLISQTATASQPAQKYPPC